ncbi:hypothetical protein [Butyricimonas paravirosa]
MIKLAMDCNPEIPEIARARLWPKRLSYIPIEYKVTRKTTSRDSVMDKLCIQNFFMMLSVFIFPLSG